MDSFKQITAFVATATRGSLSAAARAEGVTPAIVGRRLDALEERLGVRLMLRTTRKLTLTFEGQAFLEDCQRILNDMAAQFQTAIIVVTHDEKIIPTFKRIYHIRDGVTHEEAGEGRLVRESA